MQRIERFTADLDDTWTQKSLNVVAAHAHWPSREDLVDYYLNDLSADENRRAIEAHIRDCATCREVVEDLERGAALLEQADPLGQPVAIPAGAEHGWRDAIRSLIRFTAWPAWSLAAVTAMAIFALGLLLRPLMWPVGEGPRMGFLAQLEKPALQRQPDGSLALGIGATGARPEARALLETALASYDLPDFPDRALPALEQAVASDPNFEQARFWLGVCYLLRGNEAAAISQLKEAVRLAPGNLTYQHYLVWAYLKANDYRSALDAQTRLLNRK